MSERRFQGEPQALRSPERLARMEVDRVVAATLEGIEAKSVLDVGTGSAVFAEAFAARGLEVSGIDVSPEMIEAAASRVPGARFVEAAAERLPFPEGSFDVAFLGVVLHEADDPAQALAEARRVSTRRVVVLEWPYRAEEHGPPFEHRLPPDVVEKLILGLRPARFERLPLRHLELYRIDL